MSGVHKNLTISFRVTEWEREEIEAKIAVSGMAKKDYFVRSCIYNKVCVVGKKELIYKLVHELQVMETVLKEVSQQLEQGQTPLTQLGLEDMKTEYINMTKAILWMIEGASYLWQEEHSKQE